MRLLDRSQCIHASSHPKKGFESPAYCSATAWSGSEVCCKSKILVIAQTKSPAFCPSHRHIESDYLIQVCKNVFPLVRMPSSCAAPCRLAGEDPALVQGIDRARGQHQSRQIRLRLATKMVKQMHGTAESVSEWVLYQSTKHGCVPMLLNTYHLAPYMSVKGPTVVIGASILFPSLE